MPLLQEIGARNREVDLASQHRSHFLATTSEALRALLNSGISVCGPLVETRATCDGTVRSGHPRACGARPVTG